MISRRLFTSQIVVVIALIIIAVFIQTNDMYMSEGSMTRGEISSAMEDLIQITDSNDSEQERISQLKKLAREVGAGTESTKIAAVTTYNEGSARITETRQNPISESELAQNINQALQSHIMIDSCRTANKQYKIAVWAAVVAVLSTIVTWNVSVKANAGGNQPLLAEASTKNASENTSSGVKNSEEISSGGSLGSSEVSSPDVEQTDNAKDESTE